MADKTIVGGKYQAKSSKTYLFKYVIALPNGGYSIGQKQAHDKNELKRLAKRAGEKIADPKTIAKANEFNLETAMKGISNSRKKGSK